MVLGINLQSTIKVLTQNSPWMIVETLPQNLTLRIHPKTNNPIKMLSSIPIVQQHCIIHTGKLIHPNQKGKNWVGNQATRLWISQVGSDPTNSRTFQSTPFVASKKRDTNCHTISGYPFLATIESDTIVVTSRQTKKPAKKMRTSLKAQQEVALVILIYYWLVGEQKQLYQTFHYVLLSGRNNNNRARRFYLLLLLLLLSLLLLIIVMVLIQLFWA